MKLTPCRPYHHIKLCEISNFKPYMQRHASMIKKGIFLNAVSHLFSKRSKPTKVLINYCFQRKVFTLISHLSCKISDFLTFNFTRKMKSQVAMRTRASISNLNHIKQIMTSACYHSKQPNSSNMRGRSWFQSLKMAVNSFHTRVHWACAGSQRYTGTMESEYKDLFLKASSRGKLALTSLGRF